MTTKMTIKSRISRLTHYLDDIEDGLIRIPEFQRDFVWEKKEKLELFDSLKRGYPIGSLLFWKPKQIFKTKGEIGPYKIDYKEKADFYYILDGFQRLSTLFGCLKNPYKTNLGIDDDEFKKEYLLCYDLEKEEFVFPRTSYPEITLIPVYVLIDTFEFLSYSEKLQNIIADKNMSTIMIDKAKKLATTLIDYNIASIEINGGEIEDAVDIFSRINSMGAKISPDWMVSALTYNENNEGFRLGNLIDSLLEDLKAYNFENIKRELILQCIQTSFGKIFFDEKIKDLVKKQNFVDKAKETIVSIKKAVKFLFEELLVIESKLLPYNNQLIFLSYFFNEVTFPSELQKNQIKEWFWITTYASYFTIYSLSKQRSAFEHFKNFVRGEENNPVYNDKPDNPFVTSDVPKTIYFGSVRSKAYILFLLNYSNFFKPIDSEIVEQLKVYYLFKEIKDPKSVVPVIEYLNGPSFIFNKPNDLSFLLSESQSDTANYFLTDKMKQFYQVVGDKEFLLNERYNLILHQEQDFVEKLGVKYTTPLFLLENY